MPDSEELDEILNEIKNINAPKKEKEEEAVDFSISETEETPSKPEPVSDNSSAEEAPAEKAEADLEEEKPEPQKDAVSFAEFNTVGKADKALYGEEDEEEMPKKKKSSKGIIIAVIIILVAAIAAAAVFIVKNNSKEEQTEPASDSTVSQTVTQAPVSTKNPLTGSSDFNSAAVGKRPIACVVENAQAARPQWGIDDEKNPPDIIVEGEVEGGETRMLWMYADYTAVPDQIGPMRSARPPYIKFSEMFDAIFLHWGQSQTKRGTAYIGANTVFREDNVDHINQMTYSGKVALFGRNSTRSVSTEHTGVLYGDKIAAAIEGEGFRTDADDTKYTKFNFSDEETTVSDTACETLGLTFSSRTATREWTYSEDDKMYHCSDYGTDVTRKNLLVLFDETQYVSKANYKNSGSAEIYCNYLLSGGNGKLATDGTVIDITWSVDNGLLSIKDASGNDVSFNVGTTWIGYGSSNNGGTVK